MNTEFPSWLDNEEDCKNFLVNNCPVSTEIIKRETETHQLDCQDQRFKLSQIKPYKPDIKDLSFLVYMVIHKKKRTILEFGTGFSTLVLSEAMQRAFNTDEKRFLNDNRVRDPFSVHSVDNEKKYINISRKRIPKEFKSFARFYESSANMKLFNSRITTQYNNLPRINPDLIYIDGPDQFKVKGNINGWSTRESDMLPMSSDVLLIEPFLLKGTHIIIDGRGANAIFIKNNLQRQWEYEYNEESDRHIFELQGKSIGRYNSKLNTYQKTTIESTG